MKPPKIPLLAFAFLAFLIEIPLLLSFFWMAGDFNALRFNLWPISDWLINYHGGFVRRGLVGEVLLRCSSQGNLLQNLYDFVFASYFIYVTLALLIYRVARVSNWRLLLVGIMLQGGIFHMGISVEFYPRKEMLFLIAFEILALLYLKICQTQGSQKAAWIRGFSLVLLATAPLLILVHEGYLFMAFPTTLLLVWILLKESPQYPGLKLVMALYVIETVATFMVCVFNHGTVSISQAIWDAIPFDVRHSLAPANPYSTLGAVSAIGWGLDQHLTTIYAIFSSGGIAFWIFFLLGNTLALAYVVGSQWSRQANYPHPNHFLRYVFWGMLLSVGMFFIASDWGRWLSYWSNQALLLVWVLSQSPSAREQDSAVWVGRLGQVMRMAVNRYVLLIILIFGFLFHMPECCANSRQFWFPLVYHLK
jgi:hypothetical protein